MKIPVTPSGFEPVTFQFVAQSLNQLRNHVPLQTPNCHFKFLIVSLLSFCWCCFKLVVTETVENSIADKLLEKGLGLGFLVDSLECLNACICN
jgi:hypothetical protein